MTSLVPKEHTKSEVFNLADEYARGCYKLSRKLPKKELFGTISRLSRAALSVPLNLIEGHARNSSKNRLNFTKISYGYLEESQYLLYFIVPQKSLSESEVKSVHSLGDKLADMPWRKIVKWKKRHNHVFC